MVLATVLVYIAAQLRGNCPMKGEIREKWQKLCEQAAVEKDPETLLELTKEINRLLHEKEVRLEREPETTS
jgi:hypothetical protein